MFPMYSMKQLLQPTVTAPPHVPHVQYTYMFLHLIMSYLSECRCEGTQVSHKSSRDENISCQVGVELAQVTGSFLPPKSEEGRSTRACVCVCMCVHVRVSAHQTTGAQRAEVCTRTSSHRVHTYVCAYVRTVCSATLPTVPLSS